MISIVIVKQHCNCPICNGYSKPSSIQCIFSAIHFLRVACETTCHLYAEWSFRRYCIHDLESIWIFWVNMPIYKDDAEKGMQYFYALFSDHKKIMNKIVPISLLI